MKTTSLFIFAFAAGGAGTYEVDFSGNGLSSGVYFYQLTVTNMKGGEVYRDTKKAILIK